MYIATKIVNLSELKALTEEALRRDWDIVIDDTWQGDYTRVAVFQKINK